MEEDIKVLENMRDNIYGAIQFEDDYQVRITEQKEFDALNLAINHLRKTKLIHSQFIPKSKIKEKIEYFKECYNNLSKNPKEHLHSKTEYLIVIGELESLLEGGE